jgi:hypothetical protein
VDSASICSEVFFFAGVLVRLVALAVCAAGALVFGAGAAVVRFCAAGCAAAGCAANAAGATAVLSSKAQLATVVNR